MSIETSARTSAATAATRVPGIGSSPLPGPRGGSRRSRGTVGVVGAGPVAARLVRRLVAEGYRVTVCEPGGAGLVDASVGAARRVDVPADAAEDAEVVVVVLPDERAVDDAVFDCGGVSETLPAGAAVLNLSPVSREYVVRAAGEMATLGLRWLEGALIGEPSGARDWPLCLVGTRITPGGGVIPDVVARLAGHVEVLPGLERVAGLRREWGAPHLAATA